MSLPKGPLVRTAFWLDNHADWHVVAKERIGGKELTVTSAQFHIPRNPSAESEPMPDWRSRVKTSQRELELA